MLEPEALIAFFVAELVAVLARSPDIVVAAKSARQQTKHEQLRISLGLRRSLLLEFLLFVPASVALFLVAIFPFLSGAQLFNGNIRILYAMAGVASYGFPYAFARTVTRIIALKKLRDFMSISTEDFAEHHRDVDARVSRKLAAQVMKRVGHEES